MKNSIKLMALALFFCGSMPAESKEVTLIDCTNTCMDTYAVCAAPCPPADMSCVATCVDSLTTCIGVCKKSYIKEKEKK